MKKTNFLLKIWLLFFATSVANAQLDYQLEYFSGTYTPITVAGGATTVGATGDGVLTQNIPLGFTFNYNGTNYTAIAASTDGFASFTATANSLANNNLYTTTAPNAVLAPWWDDLNTNAVGTNPAGSILRITEGTAPNRVFTLQWINSSYWSAGSGQPKQINFQIKLYETTNVIEFWYGDALGTSLNTLESASVGISSQTGGDGQFICGITGSKRVGNAMMNGNKFLTSNIRFTPGSVTALAAGTYTVGAGGDYANMSAALRDLNHRGVAGAVTFDIIDATVNGTNNYFPLIVGPIAGSSAMNMVTISSSVNTNITFEGSVAGNITTTSNTTAIGNTAEPLLALVGSDFVRVQNLSFTGVNSINPARNVDRGILVTNVSATDGATNNLFHNLSFNMDRTNVNTIAIQQNVITIPSSAAGTNSNNTYRNLTIRNTNKGINLLGNATNPDVNCQITTTACGTFNSIGDPTVPGDIGNTATIPYGIQVQNQSGFTIENCDIRNVVNTGGQADGINILTFQGTSTVRNNIINGVRNAGTASTTIVAGLRATHTTTGTHELRIFNNAISNITSGYTSTASATRSIRGIFVAGTGGGTTQSYNIWHNSVSIDGSASLNISSSAFEVASVTTTMNVANNIFANFTAAQSGVARHYGMVSTSATAFGGAGSSLNNNNIYVPNDAGTTGFTALGATTNFDGVAALQTAISQATANLEINPGFADNTNNLISAVAGLASTGATPPAYIDNDIACNSPRLNSIGANNIESCSSVNGGEINGTDNACQNINPLLNVTGATIGIGMSYQWAWSSTPGGPYNNLLGTSTTAHKTRPYPT